MTSHVSNGLDEKSPHQIVSASPAHSDTKPPLVGSPESLGIELESEEDVDATDEGSGEDEADDDDDDEDDEDDEEPALKYERLGGSTSELLQKDSASALAYSSQRLVRIFSCYRNPHLSMIPQAVGTHAGIVHVLDLSGQRIKSVKPHSASVIDICIDETGDFVGTASLDGESPPVFLRPPIQPYF